MKNLMRWLACLWVLGLAAGCAGSAVESEPPAPQQGSFRRQTARPLAGPLCDDGEPRYPNGRCPGFYYLHSRVEQNTLILTALVMPRGSRAEPGNFKPTSSTADFARIPQVLVTIDDDRVQHVSSTTDAAGDARFDLTTEPFRHLVASKDAISFMATAHFKDGNEARSVAVSTFDSQLAQETRATILGGLTTRAYDEIGADIAYLEGRPEPWGDAELKRANDCITSLTTLKASQARTQREVDPRLEDAAARLNKLEGRFMKAAAVAEKREAAERARRQAAIIPTAHARIAQRHNVVSYLADTIVESCSNGMWMTYDTVRVLSALGQPIEANLCVVHTAEGLGEVLDQQDCANWGAVDQMFRHDTAGATCDSRPHN